MLRMQPVQRRQTDKPVHPLTRQNTLPAQPLKPPTKAQEEQLHSSEVEDLKEQLAA